MLVVARQAATRGPQAHEDPRPVAASDAIADAPVLWLYGQLVRQQAVAAFCSLARMGNLEFDQVPETFYIFVDQANPMVWQNFTLLGQLFSSSFVSATDPSTAKDYASGSLEVFPYIANPNYVPTFASPFLAGILAPLGVEIDAERVRRLVAPEAPSRLSCIYAFGSSADCRVAAERYGWALGEVHEFRAVPDASLRVRRVNMEIVSLARYAYASSSMDDSARTALWSAYWNGLDNVVLELPTPTPTLRSQMATGCLWEYLIDGRVQRV